MTNKEIQIEYEKLLSIFFDKYRKLAKDMTQEEEKRFAKEKEKELQQLQKEFKEKYSIQK